MRNNTQMKLFRCCVIMILVAAFPSCKTVKPYQRAYLNDEAMQTGKRTGSNFSGAVHNYREAAMGGGRGKSSGGCGCN
jgi:hypothetical protein